MAQQHHEEFLTPVESSESVSKWPSAVEKQPKPPDSPSKLLARHRLGSLLGQIRKGDTKGGTAASSGGGVEGVHGRVVVVGGSDQQHEIEEMDIGNELGSRDGVRKQHSKRMRREKRVVFELRGKAFGLRDSGQPESVYALCRKWMYGRDDEPTTMGTESQPDEAEEQEEAEQQQQRMITTEEQRERRRQPFGFGAAATRSLDLLATKNIYALPPPRPDAPPLLDPRPQRLIRRVNQQTRNDVSGGGNMQVDTNGAALLDEHLKHWKRVKQNWREYGKKREQRYADSLQLLRTVYGIAQQTQQI